MEKFWGKCRRKNSAGILSRVYTPIIESSYGELLHKARIHPRLSLVCVNLHGTWLKVPSWQMDDWQIDIFADIARNDHYKKNYLELKFQNGKGDLRSIIGFTEWQGNIIGYDVSVVADHSYMFKVETKTEGYTYNNGLWVPDGWRERKREDYFPDTVLNPRVNF